MNPLWSKMIFDAVKEVMKVCSHCKKASAYEGKKQGQYYRCRYCGHKFKEKGN